MALLVKKQKKQKNRRKNNKIFFRQRTSTYFNETKWYFLTHFCKTCSNRNFLKKKKNQKKNQINKLSNN